MLSYLANVYTLQYNKYEKLYFELEFWHHTISKVY